MKTAEKKPGDLQDIAEGCDTCGAHVENGDGRHVGDDRLCMDCAEGVSK